MPRPKGDNVPMLELMPYFKKETNAEKIERITRERIHELDIAIHVYEAIRRDDIQYGKGPTFKINGQIQMLRSTLTDNIRIRIELGLPKVER